MGHKEKYSSVNPWIKQRYRWVDTKYCLDGGGTGERALLCLGRRLLLSPETKPHKPR